MDVGGGDCRTKMPCKTQHCSTYDVDAIKGHFIKIGVMAAVGMQAFKIGGKALEHAVAFCVYLRYAPASPFEQYFYAHAAHEAAMKVLNYSCLGISVSSIATTSFALISGALAVKLSVAIYNRMASEKSKVDLSLTGVIQEVFFSVVGGRSGGVF